MFDLLLIMVVGTSIWVYFDSRAIGARKGLLKGIADMGPLGWLLASLLLWIVAFPLYLATRSQIKAASQKRPVRRGGPLTDK